jgi:hypothetical protein
LEEAVRKLLAKEELHADVDVAPAPRSGVSQPRSSESDANSDVARDSEEGVVCGDNTDVGSGRSSGANAGSAQVAKTQGPRVVLRGTRSVLKRANQSIDKVFTSGQVNAVFKKLAELAEEGHPTAVNALIQRLWIAPKYSTQVLSTPVSLTPDPTLEELAADMRKIVNMVALQKNKIVGVSLDQVSDKVRIVPVDHPLIRQARNMGTCFGDEVCGNLN